MNLKRMAERVKPISREEFNRRIPKVSASSAPRGHDIFFEVGGDAFRLREPGEDVKKMLLPGLGLVDETTRAFVGHLHQAVERMKSLGELESVHTFSVSFAIQDANFTMVPYTVNIRVGLLGEFSIYSNHPEFAALTTLIESGYFHELVHYVQYLRLDRPNEITSLMGEFLYDPGLNAIRNEYKFSKLSSEGKEFIQTGRRPSKKEHYVLGWLVAAKLLIAESSDSGILTVPAPVGEQLGMLPRLPRLFAGLKRDERDRILARYIRLGKKTLEVLSKEAGKRVGLLF